MARASPGAPSLSDVPSSAAQRSRLSSQPSCPEDEPYPSVRQLQPTRVDESLSYRHLNGPEDSSAPAEPQQATDKRARPDVSRIHSPRRTRWLIGSQFEEPLESTTQFSSRRVPLQEGQSEDQATSPETAQTPRSLGALRTTFPTFESTTSLSSDHHAPAPISPRETRSVADSVESIAAKLIVSPQTIPESSQVDHSLSPLGSPVDDVQIESMSRNSSTRSMRMRPQRIPGVASSRRLSRRSTSATSVSPAHAFLSNWAKPDATDEPPTETEPKPDDEGQSIGLDNEYVIGRTVNRGGFGVVKEVHSLSEQGARIIRAVKIIRKNIPGVSDIENDKAQQEVEHEISIWRYLKHRHILGLHAVYDTDFATFCVMDLNVGGSLFDLVRKSRHIAANNDGRRGLPPHLAKSYAYQLASALRYLHEDIRICHRDIKLENCLIDLTGPDADSRGGNLRLCDFGLADFLHSENVDEEVIADRYREQLSVSSENLTASSVIGTLEYASPKGLSVNRKLFETAGDVWAFGVVIYALCTGDLPFRHPMPSKTAELILRADWDEAQLRHAAAGGAEVIDLVKGCLEKEIDMRYTITDALSSTWFEGCREVEEEADAKGPWVD